MGLAFPDTNHRDNKKYKGSQFEERTAQGTVSDRADNAKYRMNDQNSDVES